MFDIRYHIASLVAVFLALTVGILLGSVIVDKGVLVEQQKALVEGLENRLDDLQGKNQTLLRENNSLKLFQEEALSVINGKLDEKKVAVVITTSIPVDDQNSLVDTLDQAGASTCVIAANNLADKFKESGIRKKLSKYFPEEDLSKDELWAKVLEKLSTEIITPSDRTFINEMANLDVIRISGSGNLPADQVVVYGGSQKDNNSAKDFDVPFIIKLKELNIRIIGIEQSDIRTSYIESYQNEGISTIDNIDQNAGKISLVHVLAGEDGRFGIKSTSEKLIPPLGQQPKD